MKGVSQVINWSAGGLLALVAWGLPQAAVAACACLCIEEVAYEVCTGIVTTQAVTEECTAQLQCPAQSEPTETPPPVEPPQDTDTAGLDCRVRNVYRPDLGFYKPHKVCMPAGSAEAHERLRARRAELAQKFEERRASHSHRFGRGPHDSWSYKDNRDGRRTHRSWQDD